MSFDEYNFNGGLSAVSEKDIRFFLFRFLCSQARITEQYFSLVWAIINRKTIFFYTNRNSIIFRAKYFIYVHYEKNNFYFAF